MLMPPDSSPPNQHVAVEHVVRDVVEAGWRLVELQAVLGGDAVDIMVVRQS